MKKVWFITGASRGLGRSLTEAVLAKGARVAATSRNADHLKDIQARYGQQVIALNLDVNDRMQIQQAIDRTMAHFGRIDVLVNNAGFGIAGAAEAYTEEQVLDQLQVNLYAPIAITRAVLPHMRKQRSGSILQISSVGGRVGNAGLTIYQAAKFGLSGFAEALHKEVAPIGIKVTAIEPGGFRTDWGGASMTYAPDVEGYEHTVGAVKRLLSSGNVKPMGDPDKAAQVMIDLVEHPSPPAHLILGSEAIHIVDKVNEQRKSEQDKWLSVSNSTDHDEAQNLWDTDEGRNFLNHK